MENNMNVSANKQQVGGTHYKTKFEHWDYVALNNLNYFEAQLTRYVVRWQKKDGIKDVEKAIHYYQKLKELYEDKVLTFPSYLREARSVMEFAHANNLSTLEYQIFSLATTYRYQEDFILLGTLLEKLLTEAQERWRQSSLHASTKNAGCE